MTTTVHPVIDLVSTASYAQGHPWDQYAWLRANVPVHWHEEPDGPGFWAITRYQDIRDISRRPKLFSSYRRGVMMGEADDASLAAQRLMMLSMDPPEHDRFKLLVSRGFSRASAAGMSDRIAELARDIVDDVAGRGECDLVHDVAGRLPSALIAELVGVPRADGERLYDLTEIMHTTDLTVAPIERKAAAMQEMLAYAQTVAEEKRRSPGDDIASILVEAEVDGDRLTDGEFQWFFLLLVNAGGDTARNLLASGIQLLFDHRSAGPPPLRPGRPPARRPRRCCAHLARRALPPHRHRGHGGTGPAHRRGREGRGVLRLGQPGRRGVRPARPLRRGRD
jgi:cytochrome P450